MPITAPVSLIGFGLPEKSGRYYTAYFGYPVRDMGGGWIRASEANKIFFQPIAISKTIAVTALAGVAQTGHLGNQDIRMGLYSDLNGEPDKLLVDAGSYNANTAGVKDIACSLTLAPGRYWVAMVASNTNAPFVAQYWAGRETMAMGSVAGAPVVGFSQAHAYGALPSSAGGLTVTNVIPIVMGIKT